MALLVQTALRELYQNSIGTGKAHDEAVVGCLSWLDEKYHIISKQHSKYPNLWLLKYNQIESPFSEQIVRECRGLILDFGNNFEVVCCPFFKFFNYGQIEAATIDWKTAKVQEKLDGSLLNCYYYNGWQTSTSGCPDGTNAINDSGLTFGELFHQCLKNQNIDISKWSHNYTYMFELTSPRNRVVVDHKESKVTLIGIRNNKTLEEEDVDTFLASNVPIVRSYNISSVEGCIEAANKLNPLEHEGYVVVDAKFNRIKIKSPAYIALHHIKDTCSLSKMAEVVRNGEYEEFKLALDTYPEIKVAFEKLVERYELIVNTCKTVYATISNIESQKEFAKIACQYSFSSVLFAMRKTGKTPQAIIKDMLTTSYLRLMEIK